MQSEWCSVHVLVLQKDQISLKTLRTYILLVNKTLMVVILLNWLSLSLVTSETVR